MAINSVHCSAADAVSTSMDAEAKSRFCPLSVAHVLRRTEVAPVPRESKRWFHRPILAGDALGRLGSARSKRTGRSLEAMLSALKNIEYS